MKPLQTNHGIALLELIIAIGILGILTAAVVILSGQAFEANRQKDTVSLISALRTEIQQAYRNSLTRYQGLDTIDLSKASKRPLDTRAYSGSQLVGFMTPYKSLISIIPAVFNEDLPNTIQGDAATLNNARNAFAIIVPGLSVDACTYLLNQVAESGNFIAALATAPRAFMGESWYRSPATGYRPSTTTPNFIRNNDFSQPLTLTDPADYAKGWDNNIGSSGYSWSVLYSDIGDVAAVPADIGRGCSNGGGTIALITT